jgi:hypothetical protein
VLTALGCQRGAAQQVELVTRVRSLSPVRTHAAAVDAGSRVRAAGPVRRLVAGLPATGCGQATPIWVSHDPGVDPLPGPITRLGRLRPGGRAGCSGPCVASIRFRAHRIRGGGLWVFSEGGCHFTGASTQAAMRTHGVFDCGGDRCWAVPVLGG